MPLPDGSGSTTDFALKPLLTLCTRQQYLTESASGIVEIMEDWPRNAPPPISRGFASGSDSDRTT
jgi:hypothetical protein